MNLQPKIVELLNNRGIISDEDIREFLSDKPQKTYDPFLLLNMEAGVDLILSSIESDGKICIYGDYDTDGVTSIAVLTEVLSQLTDNITYYIPSRFDEGYGLNMDALDKLKADGITLVITVDCGSVSCEEVEHAKEIGLKILVTDHHTITDKIADCLVINPAQKNCTYPFKYLAGCGVAFKLAQAIVETTGIPKGVLTRTLDLVGIGTIGDIVPLIDENRTLAKYGIRAVNLSQRQGLVSLIESIGLKRGDISSENVSYAIVPHLNASGRMKDACIAADLMMKSDRESIYKDVKLLIECNNERKRIQNETFEKAKSEIEEKYKDDYIYIIELENAHEGITGIVAGKIKETYGKPAIIVTPSGKGFLKGTGRSIEKINIYNLLKENENLFERFGGHRAACGFTMKRENFGELKNNLNESVKRLFHQNPEIFNQKIEPDLTLSPKDLSPELVEELKLLEPFGSENPKPLISINVIPKNFRKMGNSNQYSKFSGIMDDGSEIQCVIFARADEYDELIISGEKICITGTLGSQSWNGREYMQITVLNAERL